MNMVEASVLARSLVHTIALAIDKRWSKVVALGLMGLLFTGSAVAAALCWMWLPEIATFWTALTIGMMGLAAISFLACIINICILE
jgi:hypothetical protein